MVNAHTGSPKTNSVGPSNQLTRFLKMTEYFDIENLWASGFSAPLRRGGSAFVVMINEWSGGADQVTQTWLTVWPKGVAPCSQYVDEWTLVSRSMGSVTPSTHCLGRKVLTFTGRQTWLADALVDKQNKYPFGQKKKDCSWCELKLQKDYCVLI